MATKAEVQQTLLDSIDSMAKKSARTGAQSSAEATRALADAYVLLDSASSHNVDPASQIH